MLKGHDDHVITCLEFSGTRIVSGSDDNTLKVWSAITGKVKKLRISSRNKFKIFFLSKISAVFNVLISVPANSSWSHRRGLVISNVHTCNYQWFY